uniref:Uncharacterized protein n=1 Tax=Acrobeloides nanus TaxID=290746 RepID=A0A914CBD5_9BILA
MSGGTSSKMSSGYRYEANVIVFVALIGALRICHSMLSYPCLTTKFFGTFLLIFTTFFAFTWSRYHSSGLTRRRRAHFNELNVIETYQISSRDPDYDFIVSILL